MQSRKDRGTTTDNTVLLSMLPAPGKVLLTLQNSVVVHTERVAVTGCVQSGFIALLWYVRLTAVLQFLSMYLYLVLQNFFPVRAKKDTSRCPLRNRPIITSF